MAEADIEPSMFGEEMKIEMAFDVYGLDNNLRIQDLTYNEERFIYDEIERRYVI